MLEMMIFLFLYKVTAGRPFWRIVALCGLGTFLLVLAFWCFDLFLSKFGFPKSFPT